MAEIARQGEIFPPPKPPEGTVAINDRCLIRTRDGHRLVIASGVVLFQYALEDCMAEAYSMVSLVETGWADQTDVARAFGYSERTVRRYQRRFEDGGLSELGHRSGFPKGRRRLKASRTRLIHRLRTEGHSNREIARRIGVGENAVRKVLRRLGWKDRAPAQSVLPLDQSATAHPNLSGSTIRSDGTSEADSPSSAHPNLSAFSSCPEDPLPFTSDRDPANRVGDRIMAYLGFLDDAAPLFRPGVDGGGNPLKCGGFRL